MDEKEKQSILYEFKLSDEWNQVKEKLAKMLKEKEEEIENNKARHFNIKCYNSHDILYQDIELLESLRSIYKNDPKKKLQKYNARPTVENQWI